ncbi:MAG: HAMP domain-containing sensor histidine kinase [Eubacteriales bacterium]
MSIKRFLILLVSLAVLLSLALFAIISSSHMNSYFNQYINEEYLQNVENIKEFAKLEIIEGHQPRITLASYVKDPIYYIEIQDAEKNVLTSTGGSMGNSMGGGMMGNNFTFDSKNMDEDSFKIEDGGKTIGYLVIAKEKNIDKTTTNKLFNRALLMGALVSLAVVIASIGVLLFALLRYISRNVDHITEYATHDEIDIKEYKIEEFNTIAESIKNYRVKLKTKEKVKKEKFDRLLHETKTPITVIKSQLEGAQDNIIKMDKDRVGTMLEVVDSLNDMLGDITNIVEGAPVESTVEISEIDYLKEAEKIAKSLSAKFAKKDIELILKKDHLRIKTNKELLNNAVYNLLINAYKYTDDGSVTITLDDKEKTISIKDTGAGIDKEDMKNIFKPYFRGKNAYGTSGEGLGLSNVKESVEKAGGAIEVQSEEGKYTEFKIIFSKS